MENMALKKIIDKKKKEGKTISPIHKEARSNVLEDLMDHLGDMGMDILAAASARARGGRPRSAPTLSGTGQPASPAPTRRGRAEPAIARSVTARLIAEITQLRLRLQLEVQ